MCDRWFVVSSLTFSFLFTAGGGACAQQRNQQPGAEAEAEVSADQQQIESAAVKFLEAFHAHDAEALAALFGPEARMEDASGNVIEGREAIQEAYEAEFASNPYAALSVSMDSIQFITPDVALEEGAASYFPDGETLTSRARYAVVHLKKDGQWRIISSRTMEREVLSNYEYLHNLDWLVGDWIDEGSDAVIEFSYHWDDNKSYLLNDFRVVQQGRLRSPARSGSAGTRGRIRCAWIFDDAGGFGEATWTDTGDGWVVKASGVAADGTPSSATRKLQLLSEDHVIVSTRDRLAGGEELPDFNVTMVRKPPAAQVAAESTDE